MASYTVQGDKLSVAGVHGSTLAEPTLILSKNDTIRTYNKVDNGEILENPYTFSYSEVKEISYIKHTTLLSSLYSNQDKKIVDAYFLNDTTISTVANEEGIWHGISLLTTDGTVFTSVKKSNLNKAEFTVPFTKYDITQAIAFAPSTILKLNVDKTFAIPSDNEITFTSVCDTSALEAALQQCQSEKDDLIDLLNQKDLEIDSLNNLIAQKDTEISTLQAALNDCQSNCAKVEIIQSNHQQKSSGIYAELQLSVNAPVEVYLVAINKKTKKFEKIVKATSDSNGNVAAFIPVNTGLYDILVLSPVT